MASLYPLRFVPVYQKYIWGGRRLETILGRQLEPEGIYAESWDVADHDNGQSVVEAGPLVGVSLRQLVANHGLPLLGKHHPRPRFPLLLKFLDACGKLSVQVHPDDATARGIEQGSLVRVTSTRSTIELPADISSDIMPGVVCMPHLWGHSRAGTRQRVANATPGVSMNDLTDASVIDELTGNAVVNGVPVRVEAVGKAIAREPIHSDESVEEFVVA